MEPNFYESEDAEILAAAYAQDLKQPKNSNFDAITIIIVVILFSSL